MGFLWTFFFFTESVSMISGKGVQETWVQSLGREDPLQEEMATHSSILAGMIPWTKEPGGLLSRSEERRVGKEC